MAFDPSPLRAGAKALGDISGQTKELITQSEAWQKHGKTILGVLNEWVGPLAIATAKSFVFLGALTSILGKSQLIQKSLQAWAQVQYYTPSFTKLLGGLDAAKARLAELARMSANGPFKFDSLVSANRSLEILTRGMYSNAEAMKKVADAAAAAGIAPEQAAQAIGEAQKAIMDHEGIDGAVKSLSMMGIISHASADSIRNLAAAGASEKEVLAALDTAMARNNGSAKALGATLYGLSQQVENAASQQKSNIGQLFSEGNAAGMKAALTIIQNFGPVLTDLMKPIAAVYTMWNKFVLSVAQVASFGPVKELIKGVAAALALLAAALTVRGFAQLIQFLVAIVVPLTRAAAATGIFRIAILAIGRTILAALGPVALLTAGLAGLATILGRRFEKNGGMGGAIKDLVDDVKSRNEDVSKMVASATASGDIGQKGEALSEAVQQSNKASQARRAADKKAIGGGYSGFANDVLSYTATGASIGTMFGPGYGTAIGAGVGAIAGVGVNMYHRSADKQAQQQAIEEERIAKENVVKAAQANVLTPSVYMHDVDYKNAQEEGRKKLNSMQGEANANRNLREKYLSSGGKEGDDYIKKLDDEFSKITNEMKVVGAGVSPEALKKAFDMRMAGERANVIGMRASAGGDQAKLLEADRLEAQMKIDARSKELKAMGIEGGKADKMARIEGLSSMADSLMSRGQVFASSRASVGGAVGEAAGGVPPEFQKIIDEIKKIQSDLQNGNNSDTQNRIQSTISDKSA